MRLYYFLTNKRHKDMRFRLGFFCFCFSYWFPDFLILIQALFCELNTKDFSISLGNVFCRLKVLCWKQIYQYKRGISRQFLPLAVVAPAQIMGRQSIPMLGISVLQNNYMKLFWPCRYGWTYDEAFQIFSQLFTCSVIKCWGSRE